ncbi:MAG: acetyl-CoA carboxylase biotin carboxyl carrier protein subunit [Bacteroidota bacterium]
MTEANISGKNFEVKSGKKGYIINGFELDPDLKKLHPRLWHILHKNTSVKIFVNKIDKDKRIVELVVNGKPVEVQLKTRAEQLLKSIGMEGAMVKKIDSLRAPMPGLVHSIHVEEGTEVKEGDALLILEAMKMENVIKSPTDGIISKIHVNEKDSVEKNAIMLSFS